MNQTAHAADINKGRLFSDGLCLGVKFAQGQPLNDLQMLPELGVKWVREEIAWSQLEPKKLRYQPFPEAYLKRLAFYKANDIGVIFMIGYENPVAYPPSKEEPYNAINPVAYGRFAEHIARLLKATGVKFAIEIWNEPHNGYIAKTVGGNWQGAPPSPWVDHYLQMASEAVRRVKAVDRNIEVITDDDMWITHYHYLERGVPKAIDGFAVHPYVSGPPEIAAVAHDTDWTRPYQVVDEDRSFESAMRRLREQGVKKMGKTPAIWITEWGWGLGGKIASGIVSEAMVANYLQRVFILSEAAGAKATCWFSAMDIGDGPFGLKTNDGNKRPAYYAYQQIYEKLGNTRFECELKPVDANQRAFLFKKEQDYVIATWKVNQASFRDETVLFTTKKQAEFTPVCQ